MDTTDKTGKPAMEKTEEKIKFEDALARLEDIVRTLESGDLSLEDSLAAFEEGIRLSRICSKQLNEAEKRIEILVKDENGQLQTREVDAEFLQGDE